MRTSEKRDKFTGNWGRTNTDFAVIHRHEQMAQIVYWQYEGTQIEKNESLTQIFLIVSKKKENGKCRDTKI